MQKRILFGLELSEKLALHDAFYKFIKHFWNNLESYINEHDKGEDNLHLESNKITKVFVFCLHELM